MTITQNISLDVSRENAFRVVHAKQYDQNSRYLKIRVLEHGEELLITEGDVFLNIKRADGEKKAFADGCQVNAGDGTVTVKIPNWALLAHGQHVCDISILNSSCKLSTLNFTLKVEKSPYDGSETSEDDDYDIFVELSEVTERVDKIEDDLANVITFEVISSDEKAKNVLLKNGTETLYPQTTASNVTDTDYSSMAFDVTEMVSYEE